MTRAETLKLLETINTFCSFETEGEPLRASLSELIGYEIASWAWAFKPWGPRVLVARDQPDKKIGRIHVPDSHQEPPGCGWIIKIGPDVGDPRNGNTFHAPVDPDLPPYMLIGLKVLFNRWGGVPIMGNTKADEIHGEYLIMNEADVFGVLEPLDSPSDDGDTEEQAGTPQVTLA